MKHRHIATGASSMYAQIDGQGPALLLLHGGMCTIEASFAALLPRWSAHRTTVAVEQQAHGRTPDVDRPLRFEQMADDTATALDALGFEQVDAFGYSDGGNVALALAMQHPGRVRRLVLIGTNANNDGLVPRIRKVLEEGATQAPAEAAAGMPAALRKAYEAVAPNPAGWPALVHKVMLQSAHFRGWPVNALERLTAPVLTMVGDADMVTVEHARWLSRTVGGPLAVLPRSNHSAVLERSEWIASMVDDFLDAEQPERGD